MQPALEALTELSGSSGVRRGRVDPSWHQGRGGFGGLLAATMLGAMADDVGDPARVPRSLTVHFCAPCTGPFELTTEIARIGSRVTLATARITSEGKLTSLASASFCKDRPEGQRYVRARPPSVTPAGELPELPRNVPGAPAFFEHIDARFTGDALPFSGAETPRLAGWVRTRAPLAVDAPVAALLLDTLPPGILATFTSPRAAATVDFRIDLFASLPMSARTDAHHLVSVESRWADAGYTEELRDLWTEDGVLVGQCRQLLALL